METLRMKRSLDMEGLHEALPASCRANLMGGLGSKRTRLSSDYAGFGGGVDSPTLMHGHGGSLSRQMNGETSNESIISTVLSGAKDGFDRFSAPGLCSDRFPVATDHDSDPFRAAREYNPFPIRAPPRPEELDQIVAAGLSPLRRKNLTGVMDSSQSMDGEESKVENTAAQTQSSAPHDRLYTHDELRAVVAKALSIQGSSLRAEYNGVMQSKLQEQFQSFTKFNQDYISRQIKGNPFSYVS